MARARGGAENSNPDAATVRLSGRLAKILIAMYHGSGGTSKPMAYEDIVVEAFRRFPEDFQLRGYPEYPDASDIHKPLYERLSKGGYVTGANKQFRLTQLGLTTAQKLIDVEVGLKGQKPDFRVYREAETELGRLRGTRAHTLCSTGRGPEIVDSDFYAFFKVSVRTKPHEFTGRLQASGELLRAAANAGHEVGDLEETRRFLLKKFHDEIAQITGREFEDA